MINRRDFLKLASTLPPALALPPSVLKSIDNQQDMPNILVLIFDAWSAENTSLYGYPRKTTPNIDRLAEKATVYHNHYSNGHYTYPSTASLLTGVLPWTHKGYWRNPNEQLNEKFINQNIFSQFGTHHRIAYTHNGLVENILKLMNSDLDEHIPQINLSLNKKNIYERLFQKDADISSLSWIRNLESTDIGFANSVFFSRMNSLKRKRQAEQYKIIFPRGIPEMTVATPFLLETATDWISKFLSESSKPFFSYIHLLPPHDPYRARMEFVDRFRDDGFLPIPKPIHPMGEESQTYAELQKKRRFYDEYLLNVDHEFGRLMEMMSKKGMLEKTIVILTSDHGEMFERGLFTHHLPSFHQPLVHIPLLIFLPGQNERINVHSSTSSLDILPTLLYLTDKLQPKWLEGEVLPPFNSNIQNDRSILSMDFRHSPKFGPLTDGSIMLRKGAFKLTYLFGTQRHYSKLKEHSLIELYDIENDPEELNNVFDRSNSLSRDLMGEMLAKIEQVGLELRG